MTGSQTSTAIETRGAQTVLPVWAVPVVLSVLSLMLGVYSIGDKSLWDDETFSVAAGKLSWVEMWNLTVLHDPHTGLYHAFLKVWMSLGTDGELWTRLPSAIFGAVAVPFFWGICHLLFEWRVAAVATAIFVVNGTVVEYQQEGRPYSLAILATCVAVYAFVRAVQRGGLARWMLFGLLGGLTAYTHPLAVLAAIGVTSSLVALPREKLRLLHVASAGAILAVVTAPVAILVLGTPNTTIGDWIPGLDAYHIVGAAYLLAGHGGVLGLVVVAVLMAMFLNVARKEIPARWASGQAWPYLVIISWAFVLPIFIVVVSLAKPLFVSRYMLPALPGVAVCIAVGLLSIRRVPLLAVAATVLSLTSIYSVVAWYVSGEKDDWRSAVEYVRANARPGDGIIFTQDHREPFAYYFERDGSVTRDIDPVSPARAWGSSLPPFENKAGSASPQAVALAAETHTRMWVLYLDPEGMNTVIFNPLREHYASADTRAFTRIDVVLFQ